MSHNHGAATAKALSPFDLRRDGGTCRRALLADLKDLGAEFK